MKTPRNSTLSYFIGNGKVIHVQDINKPGANFAFSLFRLKHLYGDKIIPIQIPVGEEDMFKGVIDILNMTHIRKDGLIHYQLPFSFIGLADKARNDLIKALANFDPMIQYNVREGRTNFITTQDIKKAFYKSMMDGKIYPVLCALSVCNDIGNLLKFQSIK